MNNISSVKSNKNSKTKLSTYEEKQEMLNKILEDEKVLLRNEIENLQKTSFQTKNFYENNINRLEELRRLREEEWRLKHIDYNERINELIRKNQGVENLTNSLTKDYLQLKFDSQNNERKLYEEIESLKKENQTLNQIIKELNYKTNFDKERNKKEYDEKTKIISNVYVNQAKNQDEHINIIKEQYKQVQKIHNSRTDDLNSKLKILDKKIYVA